MYTTVAGAVQLGSTLSVTGYSHFKDDVSVSGNAIVGGTVSVGGGIIDLKMLVHNQNLECIVSQVMHIMLH